MKRMFIAALAAGMSVSALAELYGDLPDAMHAWAVHDRNRPNPVKISAEPGLPPSDAVVLFDGSEASFNNWCAMDMGPSKWKLVDGTLESVKKAGYIRTKKEFGGDLQVHIEWASPSKVEGYGQGRGNSGVFLLGLYEVQVLDSFETDPSKTPNPNPNYADGQAAAFYGQNPPLVNASRGPGQWQVYDIVFHSPVWKDGHLLHGGTITVFHNGVLVQDNWPIEGFTHHLQRTSLKEHPSRGPLAMQDHGNPVHFRNIWVREIPPRWANTTHGGAFVDERDVAAKRKEIAGNLFKKVDVSLSNADTVKAMLEVVSYSNEEPFRSACRKITSAYMKSLQAMDDAAIVAHKDEIMSIRKSYGVLWKGGVIPNCPLGKLVMKIAADKGWDKKRK